LTHREKGTLQKSTQQLTARGTRQTTKNWKPSLENTTINTNTENEIVKSINKIIMYSTNQKKICSTAHSDMTIAETWNWDLQIIQKSTTICVLQDLWHNERVQCLTMICLLFYSFKKS
jgi:hypothetical protein